MVFIVQITTQLNKYLNQFERFSNFIKDSMSIFVQLSESFIKTVLSRGKAHFLRVVGSLSSFNGFVLLQVYTFQVSIVV